jgi:hypothetical protein
MTEDYIDTYGPYANKLLGLQLDLIQALDRHRRGHKQTVEVRHVQHPLRSPGGGWNPQRRKT